MNTNEWYNECSLTLKIQDLKPVNVVDRIAKIKALVRGNTVPKNKPKTKPSQLPMDIVKNILLYRRHPVAQIFVNEAQDIGKSRLIAIERKTLFYKYTIEDIYIGEDKYVNRTSKFSVNNVYTHIDEYFHIQPYIRDMYPAEKQLHMEDLKRDYFKCFQKYPPRGTRRKTIIKELMKA